MIKPFSSLNTKLLLILLILHNFLIILIKIMFTVWFRSQISCICIIIDLFESIIATLYLVNGTNCEVLHCGAFSNPIWAQIISPRILFSNSFSLFSSLDVRNHITQYYLGKSQDGGPDMNRESEKILPGKNTILRHPLVYKLMRKTYFIQDMRMLH